MASEAKKVAVFDIDGTIFRSSLLIELIEDLINSGVFPKQAKKRYERAYIRWLNRNGSYEDYLEDITGTYPRYVRGIKRSVILKAARRVLALQRDQIYRYTRDLVKELNKKKYYLLAISGSPQDVVKIFARNLGFNKVYARIFEVNQQDHFTGKILYEDLIGDKSNILKRAAEKENLTLKGSIGVGDTESDIPFLKMVSLPIAFNPNLKLYKYAKKRGWEIVVERKDVIYKL